MAKTFSDNYGRDKRSTHAKTYYEIRKFNQFHDARGRFSSAHGSKSVSLDRNVSGTVDSRSSLSRHIDPKTGKISKERVKEYNRIINGMLDGVSPPENGNPELHVMGGGGGSGKSYTIAKGVVNVPDQTKSVHINADDIKVAFPEYQKIAGHKNEAIAKRAAEYLHEESSILANKLRSVAMERGLNVVIDGVAANPVKEQRIVDYAHGKGYSVKAHYINAPIETALEGNRHRFFNAENPKDRRWVPENVLIDAHRKVSANFDKLANIFDEIEVVQNDRVHPPKQIAHKSKGGKLEILDTSEYNKFIAKKTG